MEGTADDGIDAIHVDERADHQPAGARAAS
jgi:hypothetical protein